MAGWWLLCLSGCEVPPGRNHGPFSHHAYVWQRQWTPERVQAVEDSVRRFERLVFLGGEISCRNGIVTRTAVSLPLQIFHDLNISPGVALRIACSPGSITPDASVLQAAGEFITGQKELFTQAAIRLAEIQIDCDCAQKRLKTFARWIARLKGLAAPIPLTITTLPAWLDEPEFPALARLAPAYILQVHWVDREHINQEPKLCKADEAAAWIEKAGRLKIPFRVAIPTYRYPSGQSSTGATPNGEEESPARLGHYSDPAEIAVLIGRLNQDRPVSLEGIIWFRLPMSGDSWNWSLETLRVVMAGRTPEPEVKAILKETDSNVWDILVQNSGNADIMTGIVVRVTWAQGTLVAADSFPPFQVLPGGPAEVSLSARFRGNQPFPAPDTEVPVGWVRIEGAKGVKVHASLQ